MSISPENGNFRLAVRPVVTWGHLWYHKNGKEQKWKKQYYSKNYYQEHNNCTPEIVNSTITRKKNAGRNETTQEV